MYTAFNHNFGTKEDLIKYVVSIQLALKPPPYWLVLQDAKGRGPAKFNIWWHKYDEGRRLGIWLMAPDEDWRAAGYLV